MLKLELPCAVRCALDMSGEQLLAHWEVPAEAAQLPETGWLFRIEEEHADDCEVVPGRLPEETEAQSTARADLPRGEIQFGTWWDAVKPAQMQTLTLNRLRSD